MARDCLWRNIFKSEKKSETISGLLRSNPVFADLKDREVWELEQITHRRSYKEGEVVFHEGEPGVGMYIIEAGSVKVFISASGHEIELARLEKGEFFGEVALLEDEPRSATVMAMEPTALIGLFRPDLLDLIDRNPEAGVKIVLKLSQILAARLRHTHEEMRRMRTEAPSY
jgi:CRP/FNR family transcriptional regulator, cyclic AMP receptor protein